MARKFKYCLHCRRTITESMIARGEFVRTKFGMICAACAEWLKAEEGQEEQEAPPPPPPAPEPTPEPPTERAQAAAAKPQTAPPPPAPAPPQAAPVQPEPAPQAAAHAGENVIAGRRTRATRSEPTAHGEEKRPADPAPNDAEGADSINGLHQHVEAIHRLLVFEKSSPWNVLATVTQCLAVGVLLIALFNWIENPQGVLNILLVALILQVMALTFYVKGK